MKTWKRGRKPSTSEQILEAKERQKQRVKITNIVARDENLDRRCCICGKENAEILHNTENPYLIAFLCSECRKNKDNVEKAELHRFDLEEYKKEQVANRDSNYYLNTRKLSSEEVKDIVNGYIASSSTLTMGEYASKLNISRYQFNQIVKRYKEYFPEDKIIEDKIINRSKSIQRKRLSIATNDRNMSKEMNGR